jgi:hypothetical protein
LLQINNAYALLRLKLAREEAAHSSAAANTGGGGGGGADGGNNDSTMSESCVGGGVAPAATKRGANALGLGPPDSAQRGVRSRPRRRRLQVRD